MFPITKTDVAKYTVKLIVASYVSKFASKTLEDNTNIDPETIPAKVGCTVVGGLVAEQASPYTDRFVDKTIARYHDWKNSKNTTEN